MFVSLGSSDMKKATVKKILRTAGTYSVMTLAIAVLSVALHCFNFTNNFALGGVSGLSVLLSKLLPQLSPADFVSIANLVLLAVGFIFIGRGFGVKTVYCTVLLSVFLELLAHFLPLSAPLTDNPLLDLFFEVFLAAIVQAVVFNLGGSTGGTDIVGMIIKKYLKIDIGKAVLIADLLVVLSSFFIFDVRTGLYSLLGTLMTMLVIDTSIENLNLSKYFIIITEKPEEIEKFITDKLERGATRWDAQGSFTGEKKTMILVVMNRFEARRLRDQIKKTDPNAFILVSDTSDIIGNGFKSII